MTFRSRQSLPINPRVCNSSLLAVCLLERCIPFRRSYDNFPRWIFLLQLQLCNVASSSRFFYRLNIYSLRRPAEIAARYNRGSFSSPLSRAIIRNNAVLDRMTEYSTTEAQNFIPMFQIMYIFLTCINEMCVCSFGKIMRLFRR